MTMCKIDDSPSHEKSKFFLAGKGICLSLNIWHSRKPWKVYYRIYT